MSLNANEVAAVCAELAPLLHGRRVQKIHQTDPSTIVLDLAGRWLLVSTHPRAARLHLLAGKPTAPDEPTGFAMLLRKQLGGRRLQALRARAGDRVCELSFTGGGGLVGELFGRGGDLVLLDAAGVVQGALHRPRGQPYQPPPAPPARSSPVRWQSAAAVAEHYERLLADIAHAQAARTQAAARRRLERLAANLEADLARAQQAPALRRQADLLLAHLADIPRGARAIDLPDDFTGGPPIHIALDPARSPSEQAQALYRSARKLDTSRAIVSQRLAQVRAQLAADAPPPAKAVAHARTRDRVAGRKLPYRELVSAAGDSIWVGKSARENDTLTFRHARGSDLWLHVRDGAGAHVVVRAAPGRAIDQRTLIDAATLAAHFSALREEAQVDVQYALRKHVRKARAPGAVYVSDARTIRVRLEPARLARLLGPPGARNS
ncbi:MAG TPA: NFACT RNA binding domain-containing protein [Polyangia bacterium]|nr:NFACT RNA binding domain-containing protein [Polyangia bacterium]